MDTGRGASMVGSDGPGGGGSVGAGTGTWWQARTSATVLCTPPQFPHEMGISKGPGSASARSIRASYRPRGAPFAGDTTGIAECPRCRRQLLSCGCPFDEFPSDDDWDEDDELPSDELLADVLERWAR